MGKIHWGTTASVIGAIAALITAFTGLYLIFKPEPSPEPQPTKKSIAQKQTNPNRCDSLVDNAWRIELESRGNAITTFNDSIISYREIVLSYGCKDYPYTLNLGGADHFTITVINDWLCGTPEEYFAVESCAEVMTFLERDGNANHFMDTFSRLEGSNERWQRYWAP